MTEDLINFKTWRLASTRDDDPWFLVFYGFVFLRIQTSFFFLFLLRVQKRIDAFLHLLDLLGLFLELEKHKTIQTDLAEVLGSILVEEFKRQFSGLDDPQIYSLINFLNNGLCCVELFGGWSVL